MCGRVRLGLRFVWNMLEYEFSSLWCCVLRVGFLLVGRLVIALFIRFLLGLVCGKVLELRLFCR